MPNERVRWRKDYLYRPSAEVVDKPKTELETDSQVEGNLATEVSFIVLDTLEQVVQVCVFLKKKIRKKSGETMLVCTGLLVLT